MNYILMALNERISTQKMGMPTITGTVGDAKVRTK